MPEKRDRGTTRLNFASQRRYWRGLLLCKWIAIGVMFVLMVFYSSAADFYQQSTETPTASPSTTQTATVSLTPTVSVSATLTETPTPTPATATNTPTPTTTLTQAHTQTPTTVFTPPLIPTWTFPADGGVQATVEPSTPTATTTLAPFPTITYQLPDLSATQTLMTIDYQSVSNTPPKQGIQSLWRGIARLWPLGFILAVWVILGIWFVYTQREAS